MNRIALMVLSLALCVAAVAQEHGKEKGHAGAPAGSQAMPPMPKPSAEMDRLVKALEGTWKATAKMEPNDFMPGGTATGMADFRRGPGGFSIGQHYHSTGALGDFSGMLLMWWDAKENGFKHVWCDSMSGCMASNGLMHWDGNDLKGTDAMEFMGKKYTVAQTFTDITSKSFTYSEDAGPTGGPLKRSMTIHYTRTGAAPASKH